MSTSFIMTKIKQMNTRQSVTAIKRG